MRSAARRRAVLRGTASGVNVPSRFRCIMHLRTKSNGKIPSVRVIASIFLIIYDCICVFEEKVCLQIHTKSLVVARSRLSNKKRNGH